MKFEIKHKYTGNIIFSIETENWKLAVEAAIKSSADLSSANLSYANLRSADLSSANLSSANLSYANLSSADLSYANLSYADLRYADLSSANLRSADLRYADLSYAKGINKYLCTPLLLLHDQIGVIRAYKLVTQSGEGPINGGIKYEIDKDYNVVDANINDREGCGSGINLATLDWCIRNWQAGYRILIAEFQAVDIAAIPIATDGKFRVHRCKIVGEKDLQEIGLIKKGDNDHVQA